MFRSFKNLLKRFRLSVCSKLNGYQKLKGEIFGKSRAFRYRSLLPIKRMDKIRLNFPNFFVARWLAELPQPPSPLIPVLIDEFTLSVAEACRAAGMAHRYRVYRAAAS